MYDIIINCKKEIREINLLENGILVEKINEQKSIEGNIYMGKVQNVFLGMNAAFVDIGEEKNAFIHIKDILPKVDETKCENKIDAKITDVVKPGDMVLVQVRKAEKNQKGAKLTTHISLTGKYLVLMPNTEIITISQKIENKKEKQRLKEIVKTILTPNIGAIIRTSANQKSKEELENDFKTLKKRWDKIKNKSEEKTQFPTLIEKGADVLEKMIIDLSCKTIGHIVVNNKTEYNKITARLKKLKLDNIEVILSNNDIEKEYDLTNQIEKAENRKIWLKSGGFITIDQTEALTAIDVNTGKYVGKNELEQTVLKVNTEATYEIAKQLRLKDIGGIIVIDYIDMEDCINKEYIENLLKQELKKDRAKTQVIGFSKLNLLEMTRKHIG